MSNKVLLFALTSVVSFIGLPLNAQHASVDLGLSVKWATCNIGADKPEDHGDYFSWGETENKRINSWDTYKYSEGSPKALLKYCSNPACAWHERRGFRGRRPGQRQREVPDQLTHPLPRRSECTGLLSA